MVEVLRRIQKFQYQIRNDLKRKVDDKLFKFFLYEVRIGIELIMEVKDYSFINIKIFEVEFFNFFWVYIYFFYGFGNSMGIGNYFVRNVFN